MKKNIYAIGFTLDLPSSLLTNGFTTAKQNIP